MKVVAKILKIAGVLVLLASVVLIFWFGVLKATGTAETPIPLPVGMLEPPSLDVSANLYKKITTTKGGVTYTPQIGFPLYNAECWDEDGNFIQGSEDGNEYNNTLGDGSLYALNDWDTFESPTDIINKALYLFKTASYNEVFATNYAYLTEAGGSASLAGINGSLMSQSIRTVSRDFDENLLKYTENYFNQQINALYEAVAPEAIRVVAEEILKVAKRQMAFGQDFYEFSKAPFPTFIKYDDPALSPDVKDFYKPFLAPGNKTVAAGRCSAVWESKISTAEKQENEKKDFSKYLGPVSLSDADKKAGYSSFDDVFRTRFIINNLMSDIFYTADTAEDADQKPSIEKIWVDENGNPVADEDDGVRFYYNCKITANIDTVNASAENLKSLRDYTGADPVKFTKLQYQFSVWDSGLMRHWHTLEGWNGTLIVVSGEVYPNNPTYYSYRKENTYMEDYLKYIVGEEKAASDYKVTYDGDKTYKNGVLVHDRSLDVSYFKPIQGK